MQSKSELVGMPAALTWQAATSDPGDIIDTWSRSGFDRMYFASSGCITGGQMKTKGASAFIPQTAARLERLH